MLSNEQLWSCWGGKYILIETENGWRLTKQLAAMDCLVTSVLRKQDHTGNWNRKQQNCFGRGYSPVVRPNTSWYSQAEYDMIHLTVDKSAAVRQTHVYIFNIVKKNITEPILLPYIQFHNQRYQTNYTIRHGPCRSSRRQKISLLNMKPQVWLPCSHRPILFL